MEHTKSDELLEKKVKAFKQELERIGDKTVENIENELQEAIDRVINLSMIYEINPKSGGKVVRLFLKELREPINKRIDLFIKAVQTAHEKAYQHHLQRINDLQPDQD